MKKFAQDLAGSTLQQLPDNSYLHTISAGVVLPLMQALVTGGIIGLVAMLVCRKYEMADWGYWSALCGVLVTLGYWLMAQTIWRRLVRMVEMAWQRDIDGDGYVGEPEPAPSVRVEVTERDNGGFSNTQIATLPFADRIPLLAQGLLSGVPFSDRRWAGDGRLFTDGELTQVRMELLGRGLIELKVPTAPKQGYVLTRAGRAVMRHFAKQTPALPAGEGWRAR